KGKVFCKCGAAYGIGRKILFCNRRKDYGNDICNNENIAADTLYDTVFSVIQEQISFLLEEDRIIKDVSRTSDTLIRKNNLLAHQAEKQRAIQRIYTLKSELYSDYIDDILTEQEYIALNREYSAQIESIESELVTITRSIQSLEHSPVDSEKIKTIIQKYRNKHKLSQEMVDALIEKVIIYDSKNIEVQLSFDDVLQETLAKREERQAVLNG
ncbi:MAG: zinc ribbon domain-containing protein, partial [Firmicutes bacterium]|nr:zinc ribbon domain-containing protein [Bacillota bacterium]